MKANQFQKEAIRTDLEDYSQVQNRLLENSSSLKTVFDGFLLSSAGMDILKKKIMYNSTPIKLLSLDAELGKSIKEFPTDFIQKISEKEDLSQLLHYSMGVITESTEIVFALGKAVKTGEIDKVNLSEEIGDIMFYLAVMATRLGFSLENIMEVNNKKLKKRYPNKFEDSLANCRQLEEERKILGEILDS